MPGLSLTLMNKYAGSGWIPGLLKRDDKFIKSIVFHMAIECGTNGEMRGRQSSGRGSLRSLLQVTLQMGCAIVYTVMGNHGGQCDCIERHLQDWWDKPRGVSMRVSLE